MANEEEKIVDYSSKSYWLETSGDKLTPRPRLEASTTVDIAIMGAGFTGLWSAYYLSIHQPSLNIVIVEKDITGYGASGRNGGMCMPTLSISPEVAIERYGIETTRNLLFEMNETVNEIERVLRKEDIDVDWKRGGSLLV